MADLLARSRGAVSQLAFPGQYEFVNGEIIVDATVGSVPLTTAVQPGRAVQAVTGGVTPSSNTSGGSLTNPVAVYGVVGYASTVAASQSNASFAGICGIVRDVPYNTSSNDTTTYGSGTMVTVIKQGIVFVENAGSVTIAPGAQVWVGNQGEFYGGPTSATCGAPVSASVTSLTNATWVDGAPAALANPFGPPGTSPISPSANYSLGKIRIQNVANY